MGWGSWAMADVAEGEPGYLTPKYYWVDGEDGSCTKEVYIDEIAEILRNGLEEWVGEVCHDGSDFHPWITGPNDDRVVLMRRLIGNPELLVTVLDALLYAYEAYEGEFKRGHRAFDTLYMWALAMVEEVSR